MKPIQALVDEALKAENDKPRKRSGKFSPSQFGKCVRAQVWNRADVQKTDEPEDRVLRIFKSGKLFHDFVQHVIAKNDTNIQTEVKVEEDDVIGFADIVNGDTVYDLKTVHSGAFHYMKDDISESKKPNILQVIYYAKMLQKQKATLVFISKDDLCLREYTFMVNERWLGEVDGELDDLRYYWGLYQGGALPAADPRAYKDKNGKCQECKYCAWKTLCDQTEKEEKEEKGGNDETATASKRK